MIITHRHIAKVMLVAMMFVAHMTFAQSYTEEIAAWRKNYLEELHAEKRQPVKPSQFSRISFYPANADYKVVATVKETPGSKPFMIPTHSGKQKPFREYATLSFRLNDQELTLHAYQSIDLLTDSVSGSYLFIPFRDYTNYDETYGGGRYIDIPVTDIRDGKVILDFNKCYNPYCAYSDGFNCPIPPDENVLAVEIKAGEKNFIH